MSLTFSYNLIKTRVLRQNNLSVVLINLPKMLLQCVSLRRICQEKKDLNGFNPTKTASRDLLPYDQIPGPNPIPILGNALFFTKIGGYPLNDYWATCWKLHENYGPIVRISRVSPQLDIVYLFSPEDWQTLFQNEGSYPRRPKLDILSFYRKTRPELYTSGGLVTENGERWRKMRNAVPPLLNRKIIRTYQLRQSEVAEDLMETIQMESCVQGKISFGSAKKDYLVEDLISLLFRYTLEAVGIVSFGFRMGCLESDKGPIKSTCPYEASRIISANENTLEAISKSLYSLPLYRILQTKNYKKLRNAQDFIARIAQRELVRLQEEYKQNPTTFNEKNPLLYSLFENEALDMKEKLLLIVEILQGGIDATATTLGFCIYFLASDLRFQHMLHKEVENIDSKTHSLQGLPLLKAVLKETFRLRPSAAAVGRILQKDTIFSGYCVPAGTLIQGPPTVACKDSKTFAYPYTFNPLRWIKPQIKTDAVKNEPSNKNEYAEDKALINDKSEQMGRVHPYTLLPFGHGARMCPGRRLAEQEIYVALIELVQTFEIKLKSEELRKISIQSRMNRCEDIYLKQVMRLNMMPGDKMSIVFSKR